MPRDEKLYLHQFQKHLKDPCWDGFAEQTHTHTPAVIWYDSQISNTWRRLKKNKHFEVCVCVLGGGGNSEEERCKMKILLLVFILHSGKAVEKCSPV